MADLPKCALCGAEMKFRYKPMDSWNVPGLICGVCYDKRLMEHYISPDRRGITKK